MLTGSQQIGPALSLFTGQQDWGNPGCFLGLVWVDGGRWVDVRIAISHPGFDQYLEHQSSYA